jgi:hypothetical protein
MGGIRHHMYLLEFAKKKNDKARRNRVPRPRGTNILATGSFSL